MIKRVFYKPRGKNFYLELCINISSFKRGEHGIKSGICESSVFLKSTDENAKVENLIGSSMFNIGFDAEYFSKVKGDGELSSGYNIYPKFNYTTHKENSKEIETIIKDICPCEDFILKTMKIVTLSYFNKLLKELNPKTDVFIKTSSGSDIDGKKFLLDLRSKDWIKFSKLWK